MSVIINPCITSGEAAKGQARAVGSRADDASGPRTSSPMHQANGKIMNESLSDIGEQLLSEAQALAASEPILRPLLERQVLLQPKPTAVIASILASRLACCGVASGDLKDLLVEVLAEDQDFERYLAADAHAVKTRDPACRSYLHAFLNLKGFQALQTYRATHGLWRQGREDLAQWLSNLASIVFAVDIHPAARLGCGLMFDHGTGIVIGETTVIEDDVSILQNVTLGGTGKEHGDRHPKVRQGVMIGAGAKVLGNIEIGMMSKIAAGSVVLKPVPPHCTVAGVPAKVVRHHHGPLSPADEMNQMI